MASTSQATEFLSRAKVPESCSVMIKDRGCLPEIYSLLLSSKPDTELRSIVLECLFHLSVFKPNRDILAREPGLVATIKDIMYTTVNKRSKALAVKVYTNLQDVANQLGVLGVSRRSVSSGVDDASCVSSSSAEGPLKPKSGSAGAHSSSSAGYSKFGFNPKCNPGSPGIFSSGVTARLGTATSYRIYVSGLNSAQRKRVIEAALVRVKGVVSFLADVGSELLIVRAFCPLEDVLTVIRKTGMTPRLDDDKENGSAPSYLNNPRFVSAGAVKLQGSSDKKEEESWWGFGRIASALFG